MINLYFKIFKMCLQTILSFKREKCPIECCWKIYNNICIIFILIQYLICVEHYTMNGKWFAPIMSFRFFNGDRNISIKLLSETRYHASFVRLCVLDLLLNWNIQARKMIQMILLTKQKQRQRHREQTMDIKRGKERWDELGDWD